MIKQRFKYKIYTGLPTKNETSETTVRKVSCRFPHIHDARNCEIVFFFIKKFNQPFHKTLSDLEDLT